MNPPVIYTTQLLIDLVLHGLLLALQNDILLSKTYQDWTDQYSKSITSVAYQLIALSLSVQILGIYLPVIWAWTTYLVITLKNIPYHFYPSNSHKIWPRCVRQSDYPSQTFTLSSKRNGWWIASLVLKMYLTANSGYFVILNYMALMSTTNAALYTSDMNAIDNTYQALVQVSAKQFNVFCLQLCLFIWTIIQLGYGCYLLGCPLSVDDNE